MNEVSTFNVCLNNLKGNIEKLRQLTKKNIIFMVKANAYGHGMVPIVDYAYNECQIKSFGVATLNEAKVLVDNFLGFNFEIFVFSGFSLAKQEVRDFFIEHNLTPVISQHCQLDHFLSDERMKKTPLNIKINIGMNRLGFDDLDSIIPKLKGIEVAHLMGHFSSAYLPKDKEMVKQNEYFNQSVARLREKGIMINRTSISNSAAIEQSIGLEHTDIRPGLMLYGPSSCAFFGNKSWNGELISNLKTTIINKRSIEQGSHVGYGNTRVKKNGFIYHIPLGYGDGLFQQYTNATLVIDNHEVQILGRISMDITCLFSEKDIWNVDDQITIWADKNNFDSLSKHSRIIPYQMTTSISERVKRRYY